MKHLILLCLYITLSASILDDIEILKAQKAYKQKNLDKAISIYENIKTKNDTIYYNIGNILYKQHKYIKAMKMYKKITTKKLLYKKLHNLGNTYAKLHKIEESIDAFSRAIDIKNDSDTLYNLNTLLDIKKQQDEKKKQDDLDMAIRDGNNEVDVYKDNNLTNKMDNESNNTLDIYRANNTSQLESIELSQKYYEKQNLDTNISSKYIFREKELSSLEEKKWNKTLSKRGVKTLLIPITQNKEDYETSIHPY